MTTTTVFLLLAEFGTGNIPLEKCCQRFEMKPEEANKRAAPQALPVPAFRLGSQKSPWLVTVDDLAVLIDSCRREASRSWQKIHVT